MSTFRIIVLLIQLILQRKLKFQKKNTDTVVQTAILPYYMGIYLIVSYKAASTYC